MLLEWSSYESCGNECMTIECLTDQPSCSVLIATLWDIGKPSLRSVDHQALRNIEVRDFVISNEVYLTGSASNMYWMTLELKASYRGHIYTLLEGVAIWPPPVSDKLLRICNLESVITCCWKIILQSGSVRIFSKSAAVRPLSSTRIGKRPYRQVHGCDS